MPASAPKAMSKTALVLRLRDMLPPAVIAGKVVIIPVAIMVVVIPIKVMMPAVFVYVPPLLVFSPTALPDFVQFLAPMIRLGAVVSVVFNRLVEFVIGACSAPLAIAVIGSRAGHADEQEHGI